MMNNLTQIAQLVRGRDPQQVALSLISNSNINDPMINDLVNFAKRGDNNSVFNLAQTFFAKNGLDLKSELNSFMSLLNG